MTAPQLAINVVETDQTTMLTVADPQSRRPQHWTVGRAPDCAVRIADTWVSAHHLVLRAEAMEGPGSNDDEGNPRYLWMFKDSESTNGTYQGGVLVGRRGYPSPWILIEGDDGVVVGQTHLRFSFDGHFTCQSGDTDNSEGQTLAETPSDIRPKAAPQVDVVAEILSDKEVGLWDVVLLLLTGPRDRANWQWWAFLATVGSAVVVAIEWIKSR